GEKQGVFDENSQPLGAIKTNTELGIFGTLARKPKREFEPLPLGLKHEVKTGKAEILTVIEGEEIQRFSIEIEKLFMQNQPASKGMVIKITDPKLLAATGGIIQGMSGSPIIQGGKLVGAVTHVFINEPERGYGCFAEWMVLESGLLAEIESNVPPKILEAAF
ncbi:MAG TPA: SpoIVB peptidase, partial [Firmicutes bacterium]|nr:SpoIVB peptidase [Bacillota bacterium]